MVTAIYEGALASAGLKMSQFSALVAVANREKARPAELTKLPQMDESTLAAMSSECAPAAGSGLSGTRIADATCSKQRIRAGVESQVPSSLAASSRRH
jgi:hypothetical protein